VSVDDAYKYKCGGTSVPVSPMEAAFGFGEERGLKYNIG